MIKDTLVSLSGLLERHLTEKFGSDQFSMTIGEPANESADEPEETTPMNLRATLIGIEREATRISHRGIPAAKADTVPPLELNIEVLFSANCQSYTSSLELIDAVINFFHIQPVLTKATTPDLPVDKLSIEMKTLGKSETLQTWSMFKSKYKPSVVYRLRGVLV